MLIEKFVVSGVSSLLTDMTNKKKALSGPDSTKAEMAGDVDIDVYLDICLFATKKTFHAAFEAG